MQRLLPWTFVAILAIALGTVTLYYRDALATKEGELQQVRTASVQAATEAEAKLKAAGEKIASTDASAVERVAAAKAEAKEAAAQAAAKIQETSDQAKASMEALAAEARNRLQAANLPEATVAVTFRKAVLSNGNVAVVRNLSSSSVPFTVFVGRPSTNQSRQFSPVIDGGKVLEIGEREGWAFLPGDVIRVSQPGHKAKEFSLR